MTRCVECGRTNCEHIAREAELERLRANFNTEMSNLRASLNAARAEADMLRAALATADRYAARDLETGSNAKAVLKEVRSMLREILERALVEGDR